ncbi:uncharacterized protein A1O5_04381 [Cladophialophora psammophila CBS 110553]|uniref:Autophagy-related protein 101 n=1 Tax=Cladophialophora psammophila CBS 110553 TaxID=1182543 RepID=W9X3M6_9EURO|nr:uncharacterized protein A1O5_04381 [Cladophialophora psammophila CBS 110553]EXJ71880.1 hypothetical protein A1O5_04381 [Cladophialophora psammophila CBS 110553]
MDQSHREYILEVFADQTFVKDIVKGVLHTIFFHRYFPPIRPSPYTPNASSLSHTHTSHSAQSLPITLPSILEPPEISTAIESHTDLLISQLTPPFSTSPTSPSAAAGGSRGEIVVRFYDRKRRRTGITTGWLGRLGGGGQTEEEVCWEEWCVQVIVARPRSEADRIKVRRAMESSLQKTAMKIVAIVNTDKDHIPPITTSEQNPFPYRIFVNPKQQESAERGFVGGWS